MIVGYVGEIRRVGNDLISESSMSGKVLPQECGVLNQYLESMIPSLNESLLQKFPNELDLNVVRNHLISCFNDYISKVRQQQMQMQMSQQSMYPQQQMMMNPYMAQQQQFGQQNPYMYTQNTQQFTGLSRPQMSNQIMNNDNPYTRSTNTVVKPSTRSVAPVKQQQEVVLPTQPEPDVYEPREEAEEITTIDTKSSFENITLVPGLERSVATHPSTGDINIFRLNSDMCFMCEDDLISRMDQIAACYENMDYIGIASASILYDFPSRHVSVDKANEVLEKLRVGISRILGFDHKKIELDKVLTNFMVDKRMELGMLHVVQDVLASETSGVSDYFNQVLVSQLNRRITSGMIQEGHTMASTIYKIKDLNEFLELADTASDNKTIRMLQQNKRFIRVLKNIAFHSIFRFIFTCEIVDYSKNASAISASIKRLRNSRLTHNNSTIIHSVAFSSKETIITTSLPIEQLGSKVPVSVKKITTPQDFLIKQCVDTNPALVLCNSYAGMVKVSAGITVDEELGYRPIVR